MNNTLLSPEKQRPNILAWMTLGSPLIVELAGQAGADAVLIDCQHGISGKAEMLACISAARAADLPALVRVPDLDPAFIGQALDGGARGIVCPMINNAEDAKRLVAAVKYPPAGTRSYGPYGGKLSKKGGDYFNGANNWTIACAQIETAQSINNLDEILSTEGLDMALAGPNDLAISLSNGQSRDINNPEVLEAIEKMRAACDNHKVAAAIFANDKPYAEKLFPPNWDLMAIGTDASMISAGYAGNCMSEKAT